MGNGPVLPESFGLANGLNGNVFITSGFGGFPGAIFELDLATGDRMVIADRNVGSGPDPVFGISQIAVEATGTLLTVNSEIGAIVRTDPNSGNRVNLTGETNVLTNPIGIAVETSGAILVTTRADFTEDQALWRFDPITGSGSIISGPGIGAGPEFSSPAFIAVVPVPEPSTGILLLLGVLIWVVAARARRS